MKRYGMISLTRLVAAVLALAAFAIEAPTASAGYFSCLLAPDHVTIGGECWQCGQPGQPCCTKQGAPCSGGYCNTSWFSETPKMVDLEGLCEACGKAGQRCCPDNSGGGKRTVCASGLRCSANETCGPCAGADEILVNGSCVPQPKTIFFVDKPVKNSELGSIESENSQGIAESDSYSYWTSQSLIQRVPKPNLVGDVDRAAEIPLELTWAGYDHFGDPDCYKGRVYVPLTGADPRVALILAYDADLNLVGWGALNSTDAAWVSVNPQDERLYTSRICNDKTPFPQLHAYSIDALDDFAPLRAALKSAASSCQTGAFPFPAPACVYSKVAGAFAKGKLGYIGSMGLAFSMQNGEPDCTDHPAPVGRICQICDAWMQGGAFSPSGVLYYVLDHPRIEQSRYTGVHAFKLLPFGAHVRPSEAGINVGMAEEIPLAGDDGLGFVHAAYDPTTTWFVSSRDEELEGVTVRTRVNDLLGHLTLLSNEAEDDDVTLYRWVVDEPLVSPFVYQQEPWRIEGPSDTRLTGLGLCLDAADGKAEIQGTPAVANSCTGVQSQSWSQTDALELRIERNQLWLHPMCLDAGDGKKATAARLQKCDGTLSQKWLFLSNAEVRSAFGLCLDIQGANSTPGTPVRLWPCNGSNAQAWYFQNIQYLPNQGASTKKIEDWCNPAPTGCFCIQGKYLRCLQVKNNSTPGPND